MSSYEEIQRSIRIVEWAGGVQVVMNTIVEWDGAQPAIHTIAKWAGYPS